MSIPLAVREAESESTVNPTLETVYRLISDLFSHPETLDRPTVEATAAEACAALREEKSLAAAKALEQFLTEVWEISPDVYLATLELTPASPLYIGHYAFDTPASCAGLGFSERNGYMIELINLYRHFGFAVDHGELPDFLPAMVEFLWLSLDRPEELRQKFISEYLLPYLPSLMESLQKTESPYLHLVKALELTAKADMACLSIGGD